MIYSDIIFYSVSFLLIVFGVLTLTFRNIFYSLMSAIIVFFLTAIIFWLLGSEYNAVIQMAIYGFAVPIILGLSIMFTDMRKDKPVKLGFSNSKYGIVLVSGIFILALIYIVLVSLLEIPEIFSTQIIINEAVDQHSNFIVFTGGIFKKYILAFELISLILTITVAGLTLSKRIRRKIK